MELFWKNCFSTNRMRIVFLTFILASAKASKVEKIQGIEGFVDELGFDSNSNAYGIETRYVTVTGSVIGNPEDIAKYGSTFTANKPTSRFLFKLDENQNLLWKILLDGSWEAVSRKPKILINRLGIVHVIYEEHGTISTNIGLVSVLRNDTGRDVPYLEGLKTFTSPDGSKITSGTIFLVDDKVVILQEIDLVFHMKIWDLNSGKESVVAVKYPSSIYRLSAGCKRPLIVKDVKDDIYITLPECLKGSPGCKQKLFVVTKDALDNGSLELRKVEGFEDEIEVKDLKLGELGEIYIGAYNTSSGSFEVKKLQDCKFTTVFESSGILLDNLYSYYAFYMAMIPALKNFELVPVKNGVLIKICGMENLAGSELINTKLEFVLVNSDNSVDPFFSYTNSERKKNPFYETYDFCPETQALDSDGNLFFGGSNFWNNTPLAIFNRSTEALTRIPFPPEYYNPQKQVSKANILLDGSGNLWYLSYFPMQSFYIRRDNELNHLYILENESSAAREIPIISKNFYKISKSPNGHIFMVSDLGLYVNSDD